MFQLNINIAFKLSLIQITKEELIEYQLSETYLLGIFDFMLQLCICVLHLWWLNWNGEIAWDMYI